MGNEIDTKYFGSITESVVSYKGKWSQDCYKFEKGARRRVSNYFSLSSRIAIVVSKPIRIYILLSLAEIYCLDSFKFLLFISEPAELAQKFFCYKKRRINI